MCPCCGRILPAWRSTCATRGSWACLEQDAGRLARNPLSACAVCPQRIMLFARLSGASGEVACARRRAHGPAAACQWQAAAAGVRCMQELPVAAAWLDRGSLRCCWLSRRGLCPWCTLCSTVHTACRSNCGCAAPACRLQYCGCNRQPPFSRVVDTLQPHSCAHAHGPWCI